ncbi:phage tail tape measure protein [Pseudomonas quasicaspiana]|uniref:phage tail tape measure protein n=1 Tax=Pseudomonas quasicaspiana TaxID=2829821 RepID=UPI001E64C58B|nr:phage tail tape measure protein [Pseudomonas quasicaspiana]MCD5980516.1 phage tail tape measure protein [Pseudomonas quasicaspiana]
MADKFQLKALITGVDKLSPMLQGVRKNAMGLRKQLNSTGLGNITFMDAIKGGAFATPFIMGAQAAIGFETAMADVKKVVDFDTPQQFKEMSNDVLALSERLPMSAEGIAAIVAAGGQSGIARSELQAFAEDAVKMGVAFDQTAEESGTQMAKWRTAFKLSQTDVVSLADKINQLSNTGASTTGQISKIVTAIGPLGEIAGLNAGQIAAMGAALAGVGIAEDVAATGMKNFALTLTAGTSATKAQKAAYKSLRLDAKAVSKGMSTDAEGTIKSVLTRLKSVEASKRPAILAELFGKESITAIAPLLTNLDVLQKNFAMVGEKSQYAGSMQKEFESRSATTANAVLLLRNKVNRLGIEVGNALLPPFNEFLTLVGPLITDVSKLAAAHPGLIKGILGAAIGFTVLRVAVMASTMAMTLFNNVTKKSIVGLVIRGLALAAGFLLANWSTVAPFFAEVWKKIEVPAMRVWGWMQAAFEWSPLGQTIANWEPLQAFFLQLWELIKAMSVPFFDFLKTVFDWSPLGMIIKHWSPITKFFKELWDGVRPYLEPILKYFGAGEGDPGLIATATEKIKGWTEQQRKENIGVGGGDGSFLRTDAAQGVRDAQAQRNQSQAGGLNTGALLKAPGSLNQMAAANQRASLDGALVMRFENAPPGLKMESSQTNQPGLQVKSQLGVRTLSKQ